MIDAESVVADVHRAAAGTEYSKRTWSTPTAAARSCSSQWPLATQTEQTWLRSANSSSTIMRRYSRSRGVSVWTSIPSATVVTQAG